MSDTDSFINEVSEELRRDRALGAVRKYGWIVGLVVLGIVGGAAYNEWSKASRTASAQSFGAALGNALESDSVEPIALPDDANADHALIAAFAAAQAHQANGDLEAAQDSLNTVLSLDEVEPIYRDLALLKLVGLGAGSVADRLDHMDAIIDGNGLLTPLAREQRGLLLLEQGDADAALAVFDQILTDIRTPAQLAQRVEQYRIALENSAPAQEG